MNLNLADLLRNAGFDPESPEVAAKVKEQGKVITKAVGDNSTAAEIARQNTAKNALVSLVSGDSTAFLALDSTGTAPDQITVRAAIQKNGDRVAFAHVKVSGVGAPLFLDLLNGEEVDKETFETGKRPKVSRSEQSSNVA